MGEVYGGGNRLILSQVAGCLGNLACQLDGDRRCQRPNASLPLR